MIDERALLEEELERFTPDPDMLGRVIRRRERKLRRQRVTAGVLGIAIAAAVTLAAVSVLNDQGVDESHTTPSPTVTPAPAPVTELPEPLGELAPGYRLVDVDTGEASSLPSNITSIRGATNFDVSPDGSKILFDNSGITTPSEDPVRLGYHQVYIANIDGSELRQLTNDAVGASQPSWSPDGTKVVYLGGWGKVCCFGKPADLMVLDLPTGLAEQLVQGRAQDLLDPSFGPNGDTIVFTSYPGSEGDRDREDLWTIPVSGGSPTLFLPDRGGEATFSPDGKQVTYLGLGKLLSANGRCASFYGVGWLSDVDGNNPHPIAPGATADERDSTVGVWSPDGTKIAYSSGLLSPVPGGCTWLSSTEGVHVQDLDTGITTLLTYGSAIDWVDDHTLLVRAQRGDQPA